jgi:hypothetical protein
VHVLRDGSPAADLALAPTEDFPHDSDLFGAAVVEPDSRRQLDAAFKRGFQTPEAELSFGRLLGTLAGG